MLNSNTGASFAKYRARDIYDTKWVYGDKVKFDPSGVYFIIGGEDYTITSSIYSVTSLGEFSGFTDMNYTPIYEGDYIKLDDSDKTYIVKNVYKNHKWEWCLVRYVCFREPIQLPIKDLNNIFHTLEVVGNNWEHWESPMRNLELNGIDPEEMERLRAKEKEEKEKSLDHSSVSVKNEHIASQINMITCYAKAIKKIGEDLLSELDKEYE